MALTQNTTEDQLIIRAIKQEIARQTEQMIGEAIKDIEKEMKRRTPEIIAGISVAVMKLAQYQVLQDRIVFEIRTRDNPNH